MLWRRPAPGGEISLKGISRVSDSDVARLDRAEGSPIDRLARFDEKCACLSRLWVALLAAALLLPLGCAGNAWEDALETDTPQAYHQFMRKYPDSDHVADAKAHIAFHKVKRRPSLQRYEKFRADHPDSLRLIDQLRPLIEGMAFDAARAQGTAQAYRAFADEFPGGPFARRAEGNAVYVESNGFPGEPEALRDFAVDHPDSDFAAEAKRSVAGLQARAKTGFDRVGLVVDIVPGTPEVDRLIKAFTDRAMDIYGRSGAKLVVIPEIAAANAPPVRLTIRHSESEEKASMTSGLSKAGAVARTVVTLRDAPEGDPIFERAFEMRFDRHQRIQNASMLFASKQAKLYWDQFFVPVGSWRSSAAVRPVVDLDKKATAVDAVLGRSVVLFSDGDFQLLGLADPQNPVVLARYDRKSKLEHFEGVKIVGDKVMLFGQDGLELVSFTAQGPTVTATHSRGAVGSVAALVPAEEGLLLASSQGLLLAEEDGSNPERIMRRVIRGMDAMGQTLVFTDGESIFISTLALLRQNRVVAQLRLGREFKPERVRVIDRSALVIGHGGVVMVDLSNPAKPKVVSKLARLASGAVRDAVRVGNNVFLLGARGVQVLDRSGKRIVEAVDVGPRERVARTGRHLVIIGEKQLQVVDGLPFGGRARPAARR